MACLEHIGAVTVPEWLKNLTEAAKSKETKRGSFGVTQLTEISKYANFGHHIERVFCDITSEERKRCFSVSIIKSEALELHNDSGIGITTGYLLMLEVPEGAELIQNGPSIYPKVGDVIQITYRFLHGLNMRHADDRLIFAALDFTRTDSKSIDRWRERVVKFNSLERDEEKEPVLLKNSE